MKKPTAEVLRKMTIYVPSDLAGALRVDAAERDLSPSEVLTEILQRWFDRKAKRLSQ